MVLSKALSSLALSPAPSCPSCLSFLNQAPLLSLAGVPRILRQAIPSSTAPGGRGQRQKRLYRVQTLVLLIAEILRGVVQMKTHPSSLAWGSKLFTKATLRVVWPQMITYLGDYLLISRSRARAQDDFFVWIPTTMASKSNGRPEASNSIPSDSSKPEARSQTDGNPTNPKAFEIDIATLTILTESVQASAQTAVASDEQSEKELEELLRQMDEASALADGIEDRVDALLANLEGMLGSLDASGDKEDDAHDSSHNPPADAREASDRPNRQAGG